VDGPDTVTIVLADDHPVVRRMLRRVLERDGALVVVDEASDLDGALDAVRRHEPDVLVLDLNMPGGSSLDAMPGIRADHQTTRIVVITMEQAPQFVHEALARGASGYVLKDAAHAELADAIRDAVAGRRYLSPALQHG
jgi:two-component system response regulator NreC